MVFLYQTESCRPSADQAIANTENVTYITDEGHYRLLRCVTMHFQNQGVLSAALCITCHYNCYILMFNIVVELTDYADTPCEYYSGGNKRKLSLAVSLIGFPQFILLDEPTNGVDPSCRRKFWSIIKTIQKTQNLSFILTSHSMVECEALCNR